MIIMMRLTPAARAGPGSGLRVSSESGRSSPARYHTVTPRVSSDSVAWVPHRRLTPPGPGPGLAAGGFDAPTVTVTVTGPAVGRHWHRDMLMRRTSVTLLPTADPSNEAKN